MKKALLAFVLSLLSAASLAASNSNPGLYYGQIPTAAQWNSYFSSKLDYQPGVNNSVPYWDGSGNMLYALVSGDCASVANVFTCTASHATSLAGGALGAVPYQSGVGVTAFLSGNITAVPQFVTSTGTGSAAQAPTLTGSIGSGSVVLAGGTTGTAGQVLTSNGASAPTFQSPASALTSDDPFVNGEVLVDQRNAGAAVTVNGTGPFRSVDMVSSVGTATAGVFTLQQTTTTPFAGFKNYLQAKVTTADAAPAATSQYVWSIGVEGLNWSRYSFGGASAKTITVSFWARSSVSGTFSASLENGNGTRSYPFQFTLVAGTPSQVSATIAGDTTGTWAIGNTAAAYLEIDIGSGSNFQGTANSWQAGDFQSVTGSTKLISTLNATLDITGIDAVEGTSARPYPHLTYDRVLAQCQRYLPAIYAEDGLRSGFAVSTTSTAYGLLPKSAPRILPTGITAVGNWSVATSTSTGSVTGFAIVGIGGGAYVSITTTAGSPTLVQDQPVNLYSNAAGGKLLLTGAEL